MDFIQVIIFDAKFFKILEIFLGEFYPFSKASPLAWNTYWKLLLFIMRVLTFRPEGFFSGGGFKTGDFSGLRKQGSPKNLSLLYKKLEKLLKF